MSKNTNKRLVGLLLVTRNLFFNTGNQKTPLPWAHPDSSPSMSKGPASKLVIDCHPLQLQDSFWHLCLSPPLVSCGLEPSSLPTPESFLVHRSVFIRLLFWINHSVRTAVLSCLALTTVLALLSPRDFTNVLLSSRHLPSFTWKPPNIHVPQNSFQESTQSRLRHCTKTDCALNILISSPNRHWALSGTARLTCLVFSCTHQYLVMWWWLQNIFHILRC